MCATSSNEAVASFLEYSGVTALDVFEDLVGGIQEGECEQRWQDGRTRGLAKDVSRDTRRQVEKRDKKLQTHTHAMLDRYNIWQGKWITCLSLVSSLTEVVFVVLYALCLFSLPVVLMQPPHHHPTPHTHTWMTVIFLDSVPLARVESKHLYFIITFTELVITVLSSALAIPTLHLEVRGERGTENKV